MFHAAELFGQNVRLFLTEPCRFLTPPAAHDRLIRRCQLSWRPTAAASTCGEAAINRLRSHPRAQAGPLPVYFRTNLVGTVIWVLA